MAVRTSVGGFSFRLGMLASLISRSDEPPEEQDASDHGENAESLAEGAVHVAVGSFLKVCSVATYQRG
jgi:hypothetical protein